MVRLRMEESTLYVQRDKMHAITLIFISFLFLSSCNDTGQIGTPINTTKFTDHLSPYLDQEPPGLTPVLFAPELIQSDGAELKVSFSSNGELMTFTRLDSTNFRFQLFFSQNEKGVWTEPLPAPFSGQWQNGDTFFNSSGNKLFYLSKRTMENGETPTETETLWYVPVDNSVFGEPVFVGRPDGLVKGWWSSDLHGDDELYFTGRDDEDAIKADIYMANLVNGQITQARKLGPGINTDEYTENEPAVAPDGSYLIFYSAGRPDNLSNELTGDLYVSFRRPDGSWSEARNLGEPINSLKEENWPSISPDGKYLFFSSNRAEGKQFPDVYWVSASFVSRFKPAPD